MIYRVSLIGLGGEEEEEKRSRKEVLEGMERKRMDGWRVKIGVAVLKWPNSAPGWLLQHKTHCSRRERMCKGRVKGGGRGWRRRGGGWRRRDGDEAEKKRSACTASERCAWLAECKASCEHGSRPSGSVLCGGGARCTESSAHCWGKPLRDRMKAKHG